MCPGQYLVVSGENATLFLDTSSGKTWVYQWEKSDWVSAKNPGEVLRRWWEPIPSPANLACDDPDTEDGQSSPRR